MSVASFKPEIWSPYLLSALRKAQVFGGLVNHDYEGEIANAGDTVHINAVGDPTIRTYDKTTDLTYDELNTADQTLTIDQAKEFDFRVDDVDKRQTAGNLFPEALSRAGYKLKDASDTYVAGLYGSAQVANRITTVSVTTADLAYQQLVKLGQKLNEANVPTDGRWAVVTPWFEGLMAQDARFTNAFAMSPQGDIPSAALTGFVRHAAGFDIYMSNNLVNTTGDDWALMAGVNLAITFADQIAEMEALRLQKTFADAIRGLHVYGAKVVRPDCLATCVASVT